MAVNPFKILDRYTELSKKRPLPLLAAALCVMAVGFYFSFQLKLKSDFVELLPRSDRNIDIFREVVNRVGGASSLLIGVESDSFDANKRFVEDLGAKLKRYPADRITRVSFNINEEKRFFEDNKLLYAKFDDLVTIRDRIKEKIKEEKMKRNPLVFSLETEDDAEKDKKDEKSRIDLNFDDIEAKYRKKASEYDKFIEGYYTEPNGTMLAIVVRPAGSSLQVDKAKDLVESINADIAALGPEKYRPGMRITFTGDVKTSLDEHDALRDDLIMVTTACLILEVLVILLFYWSLQSLFIIGIPLAVGALATFGLTRFMIGYLNSSTAFLCSIVVGNGINFGIILLARYMEERRGGKTASDALSFSVKNTAAATASASLGASISYGSLIVTRFRGFNQFGLIGGVGMLLCWIATYLVMPPVIVLVERFFPLVHEGARKEKPAFFAGAVARVVERGNVPVTICGLALFLASFAAFMVYLARDPFEYDFSKLRTKISYSKDYNARKTRINKIFGETQAPYIILAQREDQVPLIEKALDDNVPLKPLMDRYETIHSFVPDRQDERFALLKDIRKQLKKIRKYADDDTKEKIDNYMPPEDMKSIGVADLPKIITDKFVEVDGRSGLIMYLYPHKHFKTYDGHSLVKFAKATGELHLENGETIYTAGRATIFAAMIDSIVHDGPKSTIAALAGVFILSIITFRKWKPSTAFISTVIVGVALMGGLMAIFGMKLNFLNFIALPITFGVGADYAFNVLRRYMLDGPGSLPKALMSTGGAVALCSLTTIIGYSTLLASENRALNSFGMIANAGEVTTLSAALLLTPAVLVILEKIEERRKGK